MVGAGYTGKARSGVGLEKEMMKKMGWKKKMRKNEKAKRKEDGNG